MSTGKKKIQCGVVCRLCWCREEKDRYPLESPAPTRRPFRYRKTGRNARMIVEEEDAEAAPGWGFGGEGVRSNRAPLPLPRERLGRNGRI
jgi:hypothetical protein